MKIILCLTIAGLLFISCSEDPNDSLYKLKLEVFGKGHYQVSPEKSEYEEGDALTITAVADSGWRFKEGEGSVSSINNPLQLTMDRDKSIRIMFNFKPDLTGSWRGKEYMVTFEADQLFDSTLIGKMYLVLNNGNTLEYSVTGYNKPPLVVMLCNRPGYWEITYTGWWVNESLIDGGMREDNIYLACDLEKTTDSHLSKGGKTLNPRKIVE